MQHIITSSSSSSENSCAEDIATLRHNEHSQNHFAGGRVKPVCDTRGPSQPSLCTAHEDSLIVQKQLVNPIKRSQVVHSLSADAEEMLTFVHAVADGEEYRHSCED
jgi:hypothetical protein